MWLYESLRTIGAWSVLTLHNPPSSFPLLFLSLPLSCFPPPSSSFPPFLSSPLRPLPSLLPSGPLLLLNLPSFPHLPLYSFPLLPLSLLFLPILLLPPPPPSPPSPPPSSRSPPPPLSIVQVIQLIRPYRCQNWCCFCCLQTMEVQSPPGTTIGHIEQDLTFIYPWFSVKNADGETVLKIRGPCWTCKWCDVEFEVHFGIVY